MEVVALYYNDEVYRTTESGVQYGKVCGIPTPYSFFGDEMKDKLYAPYYVGKDQVAVMWHRSGQMEIVPESEVTLSDRPFNTDHTFVQRVVDGKGTQSGYIQSKDVVATVQHVGSTDTDLMIIMASDLTRIQKFNIDDHIYYDHWIGVIRCRGLELTLESADMSSCAISNKDILDFDDFESEDEAETRMFRDRFRGETLQIKKKLLNKADWSYCSDTVKNIADSEHVTMKVTNVKVTSLTIKWQCETSFLMPNEYRRESKCPPTKIVKEEDMERIVVLNWFNPFDVSMGDIRSYTPKSTRNGNGESQIVEILHTDSTYDIVWQDGTCESGVSSTELFRNYPMWSPGMIVARNDSSDSNVYGIIQSVDPKGKVARVKWWEKYSADHIEQRPRVVEETEESIYDIKCHLDFCFRIGSVVICQTYNALTSYYPGLVKDIFVDGQILVWWSNNTVTACWPQDLFLLFIAYPEDSGYDDNAEIDDWDAFVDWDGDGELHTLPTVLNEIESENQATELEINETGDFNPSNSITNGGNDQFAVLENVPDTHHYRLPALKTETFNTGFLQAVRKELSLLRELPPGIFVKGYENRMDLFSVMILGPEKTPYEDGLFLFDIKLPETYPSKPPLVHYVSFAFGRLNPNLYTSGKVCLSLLGTWYGTQSERWTTSSSLYQVLISIQGLVLVTEPYFNEPGTEWQIETQRGREESQMYNEALLINFVRSMSCMLEIPPSPWELEIPNRMAHSGPKLIERISKWLKMSDDNSMEENMDLPKFALLPISKGFSISMSRTLEQFRECLLIRHLFPSLSHPPTADNFRSLLDALPTI